MQELSRIVLRKHIDRVIDRDGEMISDVGQFLALGFDRLARAVCNLVSTSAALSVDSSSDQDRVAVDFRLPGVLTFVGQADSDCRFPARKVREANMEPLHLRDARFVANKVFDTRSTTLYRSEHLLMCAVEGDLQLQRLFHPKQLPELKERQTFHLTESKVLFTRARRDTHFRYDRQQTRENVNAPLDTEARSSR